MILDRKGGRGSRVDPPLARRPAGSSRFSGLRTLEILEKFSGCWKYFWGIFANRDGLKKIENFSLAIQNVRGLTRKTPFGIRRTSFFSCLISEETRHFALRTYRFGNLLNKYLTQPRPDENQPQHQHLMNRYKIKHLPGAVDLIYVYNCHSDQPHKYYRMYLRLMQQDP